jgi:aminoglycoside/choline kinase family phosphotransferase
MPNTTGTDTRLAELKDWLSAYADQYELDLSTIRSASSDAGFRRYFRIEAAPAATS